MESKSSEEADECIHRLVFPLGRKHVGYGSNIPDMEILGLLMVKSLMKAIPKDEVGEEEYEKIEEAYSEFFKVIVYWLNFGFHYQGRSSI